jgi:hypothetical protein
MLGFLQLLVVLLSSAVCTDAFGYAYSPLTRPSFHGVNSLARSAQTQSQSQSVHRHRHRVNGNGNAHKAHNPLRATKVDRETDLVVDVEKDTTSEDVIRTAWWVAAAAGFSALIAFFKGTTLAVEFCSGYVLEQCLSVDNLFVILLIFNYFEVRVRVRVRV